SLWASTLVGGGSRQSRTRRWDASSSELSDGASFGPATVRRRQNFVVPHPRSNPPRRLSSKQSPQLQNSRTECCPRSAAHRPLNRPQKIMLRENARHGSALPAGLLLGLLV